MALCRSASEAEANDLLSRGDSQRSCADTPKDITRREEQAEQYGMTKAPAPAIDEKVRQLEMELEASSYYQVKKNTADMLHICCLTDLVPYSMHGRWD